MATSLPSPSVAGSLLQQARVRANLSQRQLARASGTSQSTIAAYERGLKDPRFETLRRLLHAAGFDLRMRLAPPDDHDETLDAWRNALSGEELEALRSRRNELVRQARKSLRTG